MGILGKLVMAICIVYVWVGYGGEAQTVHHVVGGDRGWDPNSDLSSWSHSRLFRIGDNIWFTYSAAMEKIVELKSKEEYEACDVSNPIRMLTKGLDVLPLEEEGIRYFASGIPESCKNGLKLHVNVFPNSQSTTKHNPIHQTDPLVVAAADGPTTPSYSTQLQNNNNHILSFALFVGLFVSYFAL